MNARSMVWIAFLAGSVLAQGAAADGTQSWLGSWRPVTIEGRAVPPGAGDPEITLDADGSL